MREGLNQMDFVIATYVIGVGLTLALVIWSWAAMKSAEKRREEARAQGKRK